MRVKKYLKKWLMFFVCHEKFLPKTLIGLIFTILYTIILIPTIWANKLLFGVYGFCVNDKWNYIKDREELGENNFIMNLTIISASIIMAFIHIKMLIVILLIWFGLITIAVIVLILYKIFISIKMFKKFNKDIIYE